jgi:hypothetical protein
MLIEPGMTVQTKSNAPADQMLKKCILFVQEIIERGVPFFQVKVQQ